MTPGRHTTFEESFDDLARVAQRVAYRLLGDRHEAEEAGQEALTRAYVRWSRVEPYAEAWVARVAANLALDRHRSRARRRRHEGVLVRQREVAEPDGAGALVTRAELVAGLRALPRRQREVVVLRYLADVSEATTAELLGCATGTVKQHAARGLAALRLTVPDPAAPGLAVPDAPGPDPAVLPEPAVPGPAATSSSPSSAAPAGDAVPTRPRPT